VTHLTNLSAIGWCTEHNVSEASERDASEAREKELAGLVAEVRDQHRADFLQLPGHTSREVSSSWVQRANEALLAARREG
jgi:hypothetical protein